MIAKVNVELVVRIQWQPAQTTNPAMAVARATQDWLAIHKNHLHGSKHSKELERGVVFLAELARIIRRNWFIVVASCSLHDGGSGQRGNGERLLMAAAQYGLILGNGLEILT
jgi:hypothetical protein